MTAFRADRKDDQRVFASIAGIEEVPVGRDREFGRCVLLCRKAVGNRLDRVGGVDQKAFGRLTEPGSGPEAMVDGGIDLVDDVDPAAIGVEHEVARTRSGTIVGEELVVGEVAGRGIDEEDGDMVGSKIADEEETIVR